MWSQFQDSVSWALEMTDRWCFAVIGSEVAADAVVDCGFDAAAISRLIVLLRLFITCRVAISTAQIMTPVCLVCVRSICLFALNFHRETHEVYRVLFNNSNLNRTTNPNLHTKTNPNPDPNPTLALT